jgi:hypothetical protein
MIEKHLAVLAAVTSTALISGLLLTGADQQDGAAVPSAQARMEAAAGVCQLLHDEADGAPRTHEGVEHTYVWSKRWMEAQRDVEMSKDGGVAATEAHLQRMRQFDKRIQGLHEAEVIPRFYALSTQYYVVEAEELLARAKAGQVTP